MIDVFSLPKGAQDIEINILFGDLSEESVAQAAKEVARQVGCSPAEARTYAGKLVASRAREILKEAAHETDS